MKNHIKHIIKGVFVLFLLACYTSCQKEEILQESSIEPQKTTATNRVSVKDIPVLREFVSNKMGALTQKSTGGGTVAVSGFGQIPLENVLETIDLDGNTNYSFKIYPNKPKPNTFYNLIVNPSKDGGAPISFVVEYQMEKAYAKNLFFKEKDFGDFTGTIRKYSIDAFVSLNKTGALPCPCEEIDTNGPGGLGGPGGGNGNGEQDTADNTDNTGNGNTGGQDDWEVDEYEYDGNNGGNGNCTVEIFPPCIQFGAHEDYCPTTWTVVFVCTPPADAKSMGKTGSDCPITDAGDCPNNYGQFGVDPVDLVMYLGLTPPVSRYFMFSLHQDFANAASKFLWKFKDDPEKLEVAETSIIEISTNLYHGLLLKEEAISFLESSNAIRAVELPLEINDALRNSLLTQDEASSILNIVVENDWSEDVVKAARVAMGNADISTLQTVRTNQLFVKIAAANVSLKGADFSEFGEAWLPQNIDPDGVLSLQDWLLISGKAFLVKNLALGYPLANDQTRNEILEEIGLHSATVALTAPLKSLIGEYWPETDEEWKAIGKIVGPLLVEIGLAAIPGSDLIDVVRGIADNDYWLVAAAIAGLTVDLFGATIVKVIAKFGKAIYKAFKIARAVGDFLTEVGQLITRGFEIVYENGKVLLNRNGEIIAQGDDLVQSFLRTSSKLETLGLDSTMLNDPDIIKAFQKIDCN